MGLLSNRLHNKFGSELKYLVFIGEKIEFNPRPVPNITLTFLVIFPRPPMKSVMNVATTESD